jgi:hypothetical protein
MDAGIMTSDLEPAMADADAAYEVNVRQKALDANKILIFIPVLKILPRNLYVVELQESKFA